MFLDKYWGDCHWDPPKDSPAKLGCKCIKLHKRLEASGKCLGPCKPLMHTLVPTRISETAALAVAGDIGDTRGGISSSPEHVTS